MVGPGPSLAPNSHLDETQSCKQLWNCLPCESQNLELNNSNRVHPYLVGRHSSQKRGSSSGFFALYGSGTHSLVCFFSALQKTLVLCQNGNLGASKPDVPGLNDRPLLGNKSQARPFTIASPETEAVVPRSLLGWQRSLGCPSSGPLVA